eukprot:tig00020710_g13299.t1
MPSYQQASYGSGAFLGSDWKPSLDWSDGKGLYWALPGTYYVLVQSAPVYRDELQYWNAGRGREGMFRLDVLDSTCPPSNPVTLQSDGACHYADFPICGRQTLISTPENSVGLNQSVLFAKAGMSSFAPYPGQVTRDLVLRSMSRCLERSTFLARSINPKKLLPGTYYAVYLMRSWNSNAANRTHYNTYASSYSFGTPQEAGPYCLRGISPPARPSCDAAVGAAPVQYCGSRRSSLRGLPSIFGNAGSTAVFELTELGFSRVGTYVSICSPELDFVPTLYIYLGCPGSEGAERLYQGDLYI